MTIFQPFFRRFSSLLLIICVALVSGNEIHARKIHTSMYGRIYLSSGDSIIADGELRVGVPTKKKKLELIEKAYTKDSRVKSRLDPAEIDSVVIWVPTAPERTHSFRFVEGYGWCYEAERTPYVSVYCFAPKGYRLAGNGGIWMLGKSKMLVVKGKETFEFGKPSAMLSNKMRKKLKAIVSDDPYYCDFVMAAKGRSDKILRSLKMYKPNLLSE